MDPAGQKGVGVHPDSRVIGYADLRQAGLQAAGGGRLDDVGGAAEQLAGAT
jgi:hypothetical protein